MYNLKQLPEDFIVEEIPSLGFRDSGRYTYFLLEKKDYDTEKAVQKIAENFMVPRKRFGYAGNKDKRGITRQYASVEGKITSRNFGDFKIRIAGRGDKPISLGNLLGNRFEIVVRNITKLPQERDWMINYFDEQRFGKRNLEIGMAILKEDFMKAASLIDAKDTRLHLERNGKDFLGAIRKVPFRILSIYIHSVQSFLWNEVAASYIKVSSGYKEVRYKHGHFAIPCKKIKSIEIPLLAFDTEFKDMNLQETYSAILAVNNLSLRDFVIRKMPEITPHGNSRALVEDIKRLEIGDLEEDELNIGKKKTKLRFELNKGCYATVAVRHLFLPGC